MASLNNIYGASNASPYPARIQDIESVTDGRRAQQSSATASTPASHHTLAPAHAAAPTPQQYAGQSTSFLPYSTFTNNQDFPSPYGSPFAQGGPQEPTYTPSSVAMDPSVPTLDDACGLPSYALWQTPSLAMVPPRNDARGPYTPPVNRLPPELLSLIFYEALPQQLSSATLHARSIPLVVSAVCNYWRNVAIDAPELWQWISLTSCRSRREHHSRKLAHLFARRAKRTGLSIFYQDAEAVSVTDDYLNVVILERGIQVIPHSERCYCDVDFIMANIADIRVLELFIGHASIQRLSMLPPFAAKSLRNLRISLLEGGAEVQSLCSLLSTSPQLQFFSWSSYFSICEAPLPTTISWSQLVRVELDESVMPFSTFYDVLITGKSLREVWVRLTPDARPRGLDACRVSHYALEKLQIYGDEPLDDVFCALHLPALHGLTLRFESTRLTRSTEWPCANPQSLCHFIANSITSLNSLYVSAGGTIDEETLIAIMALPQMASLKRLHIDIFSVGDKVFESLSPGHRARVPFLPHLSTLTIGQCTTSDGVIAKMLRRRMRYRYPLQQMKVRFMRKEEGTHPLDMTEFKRAQQAGVFAEGYY